MTFWIIERAPAKQDADEDGDVKVKGNRDPDDDSYVYVYWENVSKGTPWCRCTDPVEPVLAGEGDPWTTDRQPTLLDADKDGEVQIPLNVPERGYTYRSWREVEAGKPWRRRWRLPDAQPEPQPQPEPAPDRPHGDIKKIYFTLINGAPHGIALTADDDIFIMQVSLVATPWRKLQPVIGTELHA
jgi:hypothetical protein